jgi:hypothetical protein
MTCLTTPSFALAGSIPTEFGKLINMKTLTLHENKLSGTAALLILPGAVVYDLLSKRPQLRWQDRSPRNSAS